MAEFAFQDVQARFAAHIRDPEMNAAPDDIEDRRMAIYRRLFYNNIDNFLSQAFPVLRRLYADEDWAGLVRGFYAQHVCERPQFYQVAEEFLDYLQNCHAMRPVDPAFLLELAHYEWVELVLAIDATPMPDGFDPNADPMSQVCVCTPWLRVLTYTFPVHLIGPEFQPEQAPAEPTCLLVFRQRDERVGFLELNLITARFVELLASTPQSGEQALAQVAQEAGLSIDQIAGFARALLDDLHRRGVVLGARPSAD